MNEYVNKQNCRIRTDNNPPKIQDRAMPPEKVNVQCELQVSGVFVPYILENDINQSTYVNHFIFWPEFNDLETKAIWLRQDNANGVFFSTKKCALYFKK